MDFINQLMPNFERLSGELLECIGQTFTMLAVSGSIAWVLGVAVGVLLTVCRPGGILENRVLFTVFDRGIDIIRSIPFIILIVLLIPVSRFLVGTGSGVTGSFVALVAGTVPFFARQIESVLVSIHGVVPHYMLVVDRQGATDTLEIQVELSDTSLLESFGKIQELQNRIKHNVHTVLGIQCKVSIVEPNTIERFVGKAKRIVELPGGHYPFYRFQNWEELWAL